MANATTNAGQSDAAEWIETVEPDAKRAEAQILDAMFRRATEQVPRMWGGGIVGYGSYHYRYASGHEGDAPRVGFSPRKAKHSLYLLGSGDAAVEADLDDLLAKLGKHSRGAGCLYVNKLADIDLAVLEEMVMLSWATPRAGEVA